MTARGVDLDIVELSPSPDALNVIVPNRVVLNGLEVLVPSDSKIDVQASEYGVVATLSVLVGKLNVRREWSAPADESTPIFDAINDALLLGCGWQLGQG